MKAKELDSEVDCPICDGTGDEPWDGDGANAPYKGDCPRCGGGGTINRYQDGPDGEVVINEEYVQMPSHARTEIETMPIRSDDSVGGFNRFFGPETPDHDPSSVKGVDEEAAERAKNASGNPVSKNPNPTEIKQWMAERGDEHTKRLFEQLEQELSN